MNKLLAYLKTLVESGKITADEYKAQASNIESVKLKLSEKDAKITELGDELKPIQEAKADNELKEAFIKAGGHESKFEDFKDAGGNAENAADKLTRFASLKTEAEPDFDGDDISGRNDGEVGDEDSGTPQAGAEGSLIA